jgi:hypothetical protein
MIYLYKKKRNIQYKFVLKTLYNIVFSVGLRKSQKIN